MQSNYRKVDGQHREAGTGTVKVYETGVVGYQRNGQSHADYARNMNGLKGVTAKNGDQLISRHFSSNR